MKSMIIAGALALTLTSISFAKEDLQPDTVARLNQQKILGKLRVYVSKRVVVVREYDRVDSTDVNGGNVQTSLKRVMEKTIITRNIKGKIIAEANQSLFVSFDPSCQSTDCAYRFTLNQQHTKGYGLDSIPEIAGSVIVDSYKGLLNGKTDQPASDYYAKRVKLKFSQKELNDTIKRTVRPSGYDVE